MRDVNDLDTYRPAHASVGDFSVTDPLGWDGASGDVILYQNFVGARREWMLQLGYVDDFGDAEPTLKIRFRKEGNDWGNWVEAKATLPPPVVLTSLTPNTAEIGGPQLTLRAHGSGFTARSVINFNGGDEPTTYVSATEVTTIVKPETAEVAGAFPVTVRTGTRVSAPRDFTFTEPVPPE